MKKIFLKKVFSKLIIVILVVSSFALFSCNNDRRKPDKLAGNDNLNKSSDDNAIKNEAVYRQQNNLSDSINVIFQNQKICCGDPIPQGWIKTNDEWNPTVCGNPTYLVYNVCTITRYDNMSIGQQLSVCADAPTPVGWVTVNTMWVPTNCGHPSIIVHNMKIIRRLN